MGVGRGMGVRVGVGRGVGDGGGGWGWEWGKRCVRDGRIAGKRVYEGGVDMGGEGKWDKEPWQKYEGQLWYCIFTIVHSLIFRLHSRLGARLTGPYRYMQSYE